MISRKQISSGPGWLASEKWDIMAKCDDEKHSGDETKIMLRYLLDERFSLKFRHETQERPVYVLTVAKGGPKFKPSSKKVTNIRSGAHSISIDRGNIAQMTRVLATALGRPVVNNTGLTGVYDLSVVWDDAPVRDGGIPGARQPGRGEVSVGDEHGSIFTALQEQSGLRLKSARALVEVLVVDNAERATTN